MMLSIKISKIKPSATLAITAKANEMKANGRDVVGFGAGEPDFNTPEHINQAAIKAINEGFTKYTPASGIMPLRQAVCNKLKNDNNLDYKPNQIVISNGAKHSLCNTFMAMLNPGDEVLLPAPYWLSYPEMIKLADGVPVQVNGKKENQYKATVEDFEAKLTPKTKALLINSPSNPTGMLYTEEELRQIAEFAVKNDLFVVSDEIYEKLIYDDAKHISIASFGDEIYKRTIIVNGVAKSHSMTGWRIGFTASSVELATMMGSLQSHNTSNANSIAQKATIAALEGPQDCVETMRQEFDRRRVYMYNRISKIPYVCCYKPQGAFYIFLDCQELCSKTFNGQLIGDSANLAKLLLEEANIAVVPCDDFGIPYHIRLSYAISKDEIEKGLDRLEQFVNLF